jgi:hypothetical protein
VDDSVAVVAVVVVVVVVVVAEECFPAQSKGDHKIYIFVSIVDFELVF